MPKTDLAVRRPVARESYRPWACLALLAAAALASISGGVACLWYHAHAADPEDVLGPAGIVFLICGLAQLRIATIGWRGGRQITATILRSCRLFLAGAFFAYLAALAIGPVPSIGCGWLAAVTVWYSLLLVPLAASPRVLEIWRGWMQGRAPRRLGGLVTVAVLLVIAAEAGLQTCKFVKQPGWLGGSKVRPIAGAGPKAGSAFQLDTAELSPIRQSIPGLFRVAIVGDAAVLRGAKRNGYLARVEQMLPGLKLAPLATPNSWASADLNAALAALRPDLVLAVVSVCEDLTHGPEIKSWFDWRQLELPTWFATKSDSARGTIGSAISPQASGDFESFLRSLGPQLAACRTPIDETMQARWQATLAHLDRLLENCRRQQMPLALVLVPGEIQVNRGLCVMLARRMGCTDEQFDVDLPQRRLAGFADHRKLPLVDLLPHLRLCRQSPYEPNATAWNEQGHAAAAAAIGGWLESRYGSQLASAAQLSSAP
jgi:hypothetical protein